MEKHARHAVMDSYVSLRVGISVSLGCNVYGCAAPCFSSTCWPRCYVRAGPLLKNMSQKVRMTRPGEHVAVHGTSMLIHISMFICVFASVRMCVNDGVTPALSVSLCWFRTGHRLEAQRLIQAMVRIDHASFNDLSMPSRSTLGLHWSIPLDVRIRM